MTFETHTLSDPIAQYIESIFHYKDFIPDHSIERVVPTGHIFIIFELDGIPRNTFNNETLQPNAVFTKVWVSGMHQNYLSISAHPNSEMLVIQFKPFGGFPFFHFPIHQLNDKVVPAEEIFGTTIFELRDQLLAKETAKQKFKVVDNWLNDRLDINRTPATDILQLFEKIKDQPATAYNTIIKTYPKTQKHLIDQFKKYCGYTPKGFHKILRFNEMLRVLQNQEKISWSQIAYQCGYSDQSHFIKEFKRFSGFNPEAFISHDFHRDETNFFPLDREG